MLLYKYNKIISYVRYEKYHGYLGPAQQNGTYDVGQGKQGSLAYFWAWKKALERRFVQLYAF